ncbi:hypothetical protein K435DRAFT_784597 [Dendrothele bispora CBS 962.96]|uniref:Uncharacterized protein n=1 Tax=Dendrothele bispora (strain CBS 962.96) TaxID=1314807 RepID=A0A4S8L2H8_DENBC|nr:hypothetical protein K435DRAFT_784597 [Dendrothele bispora CBS 962.96]
MTRIISSFFPVSVSMLTASTTSDPFSLFLNRRPQRRSRNLQRHRRGNEFLFSVRRFFILTPFIKGRNPPTHFAYHVL